MGLDEFKRKNLKISKPTYDMLAEQKRGSETWDGFFERMMEEDTSISSNQIKNAVREVLREEEFKSD